jgi:hypothetical protein
MPQLKIPEFQYSLHMNVVSFLALGTDHLYSAGDIRGTGFCKRLSQTQGSSAAGRIMLSVKNSDPRPSGW